MRAEGVEEIIGLYAERYGDAAVCAELDGADRARVEKRLDLGFDDGIAEDGADSFSAGEIDAGDRVEYALIGRGAGGVDGLCVAFRQ